MNLLARILSHGFAIAVVLLLAAGLIYRGELFPELELPEILAIGERTDSAAERGTDAGSQVMPAPVVSDTAEEGPDTPVEIPVAEPDTATAIDEAGTPAPASMQAIDDVVPAETAAPAETEEQLSPDIVADEVPAEAPPETDPVSDPPVPAAAPAVTEPAGEPPAPAESELLESVTGGESRDAAELAPAPVAPVPASAITSDDTADAPATSAAPVAGVDGEQPALDTTAQATDPGAPPEAVDAVPPSARTATGGTPAMGPYQLLAAAREAYWLRDYEDAEKYYRQLTEVDPENPDGYGELGNMYFSQGQWDEAATAYFDAGTRLIRQDLLDQAQQMVDVIRGLNGAQADVLAKQLAAARTATP
jgi:hypothetical protein